MPVPVPDSDSLPIHPFTYSGKQDGPRGFLQTAAVEVGIDARLDNIGKGKGKGKMPPLLKGTSGRTGAAVSLQLLDQMPFSIDVLQVCGASATMQRCV